MPMSERLTESLSNDIAHDDYLPAFYHDCNLFHHDFDPQHNLPFHFSTIHRYQTNDSSLQTLLKTNNAYFSQRLGTYNIICHKASPSSSDWKIALPSNMLCPITLWYYKTLAHSSGMDHLEALLKRNFFHPQIRKVAHSIVSNCPIAPMVCTSYKPYGHLAPCTAPITPWSEVHVDCIGPWQIRIPNTPTPIKFYTLTCIDPVTNLIEIICFTGPPTAMLMLRLFENHWLSCYPCPKRIVHDHGPEFHVMIFNFCSIMQASSPSILAPTLQRQTPYH